MIKLKQVENNSTWKAVKILFDYSKLKGKIREKFGSDEKYAEILGISKASVSAKLNSKVPFSITEMDKTILALEIDKEEIYEYFFTKKVEKNSTNLPQHN